MHWFNDWLVIKKGSFKRLRCSLWVSNLCVDTQAGCVSHTWPPWIISAVTIRGAVCHLSLQLAGRHGEAERRLPAQRPGNQQTFVLHLLQTHHHLLGTEGTDGRVKSQRITHKRLRLWFSVITKQSCNYFPDLPKKQLNLLWREMPSVFATIQDYSLIPTSLLPP